jgi:anthranilate phosphoribosyltransferase
VSALTPQEAVARLADGHGLGEAGMASVMTALLRGEATPAQVGAILLGLRQKGETVEELVAAARVLRAHAVPLPDAPSDAVDTCGTGGDGAGTFNVSTAAALVLAGAGLPVAKHGNRAVSGCVGSADVLEHLGVAIDLPPATLAACLREIGIAFLFAPAFHPALRQVASARRELGVRTLFNLLGPLLNPAGVRRQVIGVGDATLLERLARVLAALGCERAWVVHGTGGLDELALEGPSEVAVVEEGGVRWLRVHPEDAGVASGSHAALRVSSPADSAARIRDVLGGAPGAARDIVVLNAAAALVVAGAEPDLRAGGARAREVLDSGAAAAVLERLAAYTRAARPAEADAAPSSRA